MRDARQTVWKARVGQWMQKGPEHFFFFSSPPVLSPTRASCVTG
jgi:hypothetical protein